MTTHAVQEDVGQVARALQVLVSEMMNVSVEAAAVCEEPPPPPRCPGYERSNQ